MHRIAKGSLQLAWRLGVFVVGTILLLAGVIMIVTPGPAIVFIPLGLAVLATEFACHLETCHFRTRPGHDDFRYGGPGKALFKDGRSFSRRSTCAQ